jgi:hypothetical protein
MKPVISGMVLVAVVGLTLPVRAQTQASPPAATTPSINMPAPSQPPAASEKAITTPAPAAPEKRPKRQVRRAKRYAPPYRYGYYDPWGTPSDHVANELNRDQLQGGWYGGGVPYPYAPYAAPYAPYAAPYAPHPYYPWGY